MHPPKPLLTRRVVVALLIGALAATYVVLLAIAKPGYGSDFDPIRAGARLLLHGQDPYASIGPGRALWWNYRLRYPMPALLLALPFVAVPIVAARAIFAGASCALLAFVVTRESWKPLAVFASASMLDPFRGAIGLVQWTPLMLAVCFVPWLGFVLPTKPNLGIAALSTQRDRRAALIALATGLILIALSFAIAPHWIGSWREATSDADDVRPLIWITLRYGGPILLLACLRWRDPRARLLVSLAVVPANPGLYEGALLFYIPRTRIEIWLLCTLSWIADLFAERLSAGATTYVAVTRAFGVALFALQYLPALSMLFLSRPEVPSSPAASLRRGFRKFRPARTA